MAVGILLEPLQDGQTQASVRRKSEIRRGIAAAIAVVVSGLPAVFLCRLSIGSGRPMRRQWGVWGFPQVNLSGLQRRDSFGSSIPGREQATEERVGAGIFDEDMDEFADQRLRAVEDDDVVGAGAASKLQRRSVIGGLVVRVSAQFVGPFAWPFDQNFDDLADEAPVIGEADPGLDGEEIIVAAAFDLFGNIVGVKLERFRTGAGTVLEDVAVFKTSGGNEIAGALERFFGFAAETDDKVAADGHPGNGFATASEHVAVKSDSVHPLHSPQDDVATGLGWHVEVAADFGQVTNRLQQVIGHVAGEIGDELDAADARDVVQVVEQIRQPHHPSVTEAVVITVDGLANESDFLASLVGEVTHLGKDFVGMSALLRPADAGNDAVGAELVAAKLRADVSLEAVGAQLRFAKRVVTFEAALDFRSVSFRPAETDGQLRLPSVFDFFNQME